jgi:hypothetical protein
MCVFFKLHLAEGVYSPRYVLQKPERCRQKIGAKRNDLAAAFRFF